MTNPIMLPELRELIEENDIDSLKEFCESGHPEDIADFISALAPDEVWNILKFLSPETKISIFRHLEEELQKKIAISLKRDELVKLFTDMPPDDRADLFKRIPEERREMILPAMAQAEREDIRRLASHPEGTAGSAMTSDYAALPPNITAAEAIARLRQEAPDKETIYYAYVIDENRRLIGQVSLKDLILVRPETHIGDMMKEEVISAITTEDQESAARKIQKYDLIALPVVNETGALTGIITHDDAFDIITQEQTEDIEKLMAITGAHEAGSYLRTPAFSHFRRRVTWIVILAGMGLISGMIIHNFRNLLMNMLILALYMPMLADTGGNTGSQSATLVIRALALGEIEPRDILRVLLKELSVGFLLALVLGILSWLRVLFFTRGVDMPAGISLGMVGLAIGLALGMQVICATLIGALLPLIASRLKFDPAIVASPALTTIVDIVGLIIYFFTAKAVLGI
ncbi:magnesium transporter [Candidatus Sumerlaeota bacterium]|nr:magnesium transporter [Candidatus Sumerlaeota bacterium]